MALGTAGGTRHTSDAPPARAVLTGVDVAAALDRARSGSARDVGRLVSVAEQDGQASSELMRTVGAAVTRARIIGITGAPGVGKSTMTGALVTALRRRGSRVAVLAVDPSSPFSGGALLGDRVRMQALGLDEGVFIRSMASRGHLGGLAVATPRVTRLLEAIGFDIVLIETVGVGQSELDIATAADTTLVLVAPGMGDGIQAAKAGILEVPDILVVNKADRDGADRTARELSAALALTPQRPNAWSAPVLLASAADGRGVDEVLAALDAHEAWLVDTGEGARRRESRLRSEILDLVHAMVQQRIEEQIPADAWNRTARSVSAGEQDVREAAASLLAGLTDGSASIGGGAD